MTIKRRYAPDTNFFLQFKAAEEVPWGDLTGEAVDEVELVVLIAVASELDHHKGGGNGRRVKRARKILSQLRPLVSGTAPGDEVVVRKANPRVSYRLAPVLSAERQRHELLDPTKADCRIVAEAMACSKELYGGELALMSHDTGPISYARAVGLKCHLLPDEWLLDPETDEAEKENKALREKIKALENAQPQVTLELADEGVLLEKTVPVTITLYPPISKDFLDRAIRAVALDYPEKRGRTHMGAREFHLRQADTYNRLRKDWLVALRHYLKVCPSAWNKAHDPYEVHLTLKNPGTVSADHLVVEVFAHGGLRLVDPDLWEDERKDPSGGFPSRPPPPTVVFGSSLEDGAVEPSEPVFSHGSDEPEDRPRLIGRPGRHFDWWWDRPQLSSIRLEGECGEFRHGIGHEVLGLLLRAAPEVEGSTTGSLEVRYSAKNLPEAQSRTWRVEIEVEPGDSEGAIAEILKDELGVEL
ncbi:PIN domain-containing protein [Lysobacter enzymogenes]|uniref:PIN domain-containing protein n=1 Tax=Lysobacter enzymogenes TaxID=69 RepID=UPI001A96B55A|nr:PIN domain-containing protein [Lysobacter enzymogenes]QQP97954.1 hypothetical protein JHW38_08110 [Lysobacter enzymogenes]